MTRFPLPVSDEDLHELFQAVEGVDTDHPDYVELFDEWADEYRTDLAVEYAEASR